MSTASLASLEKLIGGPRDGALLRYALGCEYLQRERHADAIAAFNAVLERDPRYSAAWKLLGKAYAATGDAAAARTAWERGIAVAEERGDVQASKEMRVFLRRLDKNAGT